MLILVLLAGMLFGLPALSTADIGLLVLEPIGAVGVMTRAGHSAIYLSNVCPDRSPITLRLCRPGERGGVVSKYSPISENEDYDWAIVPVERFLTGFDTPELSPLIGGQKLQGVIQRENFDRLFASILTGADGEHLPDGEWKTTIATRFERTIYQFTIATTADEDRAIIEAFETAPNRSRFNFFYRNCSNQAKAILNLVLSEPEAIGDRVGGLTMETPKGLAKTLVERALDDPALQLRAERYPQLPGTFPRSLDMLFPLENTYRNVVFAPYWAFFGFSEFALGAMFYHQVVSPFSLVGALNDFLSPRAVRLTYEQRRLQTLQDDVRAKLTAAKGIGDRAALDLEQIAARVSEQLQEVRHDKDAEVRDTFGSAAQWREFEAAFRVTAHDLGRQAVFPDDVRQRLVKDAEPGALSRFLVGYFETHGEFYIEMPQRGPWMRLRLADPDWQSTGLSESQVMAGSPRVAVLVLAAAVDYYLSLPEGHRERIEHAGRILALLRQAATALVPASDR